MPSLVEIRSEVLEETFFKCHQCTFSILLLFLHPHPPLKMCVTLNRFQCIFTISLLSSLGNGLGSFEHTRICFTQGQFVSTLVDIGLVALEKNIFKCRQCIFLLFRYYFFLEKGVTLHLNKVAFLSSTDSLCQI